MSAFTKFNGVFFTELDRELLKAKGVNFDTIGTVNAEISGMFFTQSQLMNLDHIKAKLCKEVVEKGGNALIEFKYGQKSVGALGSILNLDDINWYGTGLIIFIKR